MTTTTKKKVNYARIILVTLAVIGSITIIDNTYRLGSELFRTIKTHQWSTTIIK